MGTKTKKSRQRTSQQTTFSPLPLGKPAFFGPQEQLFRDVGETIGQRLRDPLTSPGFAAGRDILSRREESLKRDIRGVPGIFKGLRFGAARDVEAATTRSLSDLIGQIQQNALQNALVFATGGIPRGGVGVTSQTGQVSTTQPGRTAGEQFGQIGLQTLGSFGQGFGERFGQGLGGAAAGGVSGQFGGTLPQGVFGGRSFLGGMGGVSA